MGWCVWRALLQPDVVGNFGEGTFALLLQPGVRHCGIRCREREATMMQVFRGSYTWDGEGSGEGGDGMFTEAKLFITWRVRLARFAIDHTGQSEWGKRFFMVWGETGGEGW